MLPSYVPSSRMIVSPDRAIWQARTGVRQMWLLARARPIDVAERVQLLFPPPDTKMFAVPAVLTGGGERGFTDSVRPAVPVGS